MIDTPEVVLTEARPAAFIHLRIPRADMQKQFGATMQELMDTLEEQGVTPAGPVFAHHLKMEPDTFDFRLGVPVDEPVREVGRVETGELPEALVARTVYYGPYEGLPGAWGEFDAWMKDRGHEQAPDLWESYVEGPHSTSDPADWRTELNRRLVGGDRGDSDAA